LVLKLIEAYAPLATRIRNVMQTCWARRRSMLFKGHLDGESQNIGVADTACNSHWSR